MGCLQQCVTPAVTLVPLTRRDLTSLSRRCTQGYYKNPEKTRETIDADQFVALLEGNDRLSALGVTNLEVSMKNINNKKITSIIAAKLNSGSTLALRFNAIIFLLQKGD